MSRPVSIVIASLDDRDLLTTNLPPLIAEIERRAAGDEIVVVDDTGTGALARWCEETHPPPSPVRAIARAANGGFAAAMTDGVRAARNALVFLMNPDVRVHKGFLEPLVDALADPDVHSAVPRLLLFGEADRIESVTGIKLEGDVASIDQPGLGERAPEFSAQGAPPAFAVTYGIGGAVLLRRDEFLAAGFDPLYEPFYLEDLDLGFAAWRAGRKVVYRSDSIAEHHHRGTIGKRVEPRLVRAIIERNRYLFQWRFLDGEERLLRHAAALQRIAIDAYLREDRDELLWLAMALERLDELRAARARLAPARLSFDEVVAASRPAPLPTP